VLYHNIILLSTVRSGFAQMTTSTGHGTAIFDPHLTDIGRVVRVTSPSGNHEHISGFISNISGSAGRKFDR